MTISWPGQPAQAKTIIITGANTSLGYYTAAAFLAAGASGIALLDSNESSLERTKARLSSAYPNTASDKILAATVDFTDAQSLGVAAHNIRASLGAWDIFVHASFAVDKPRVTLRGSDDDDWWRVFEHNVRSVHHIARHFLTKTRQGAVIMNVGDEPEGEFQVALENASAFAASMIARRKLFEILQKENEEIGLTVFTGSLRPSLLFGGVDEDVEARDAKEGAENIVRFTTRESAVRSVE